MKTAEPMIAVASAVPGQQADDHALEKTRFRNARRSMNGSGVRRKCRIASAPAPSVNSAYSGGPRITAMALDGLIGRWLTEGREREQPEAERGGEEARAECVESTGAWTSSQSGAAAQTNRSETTASGATK